MMQTAETINIHTIGEAFAEITKEEGFATFLIVIGLILALIVLIVVKIIHKIVSGKHTKISGMVGLDEEEQKDRNQRQEKKELEQAIRDHDQAIRKYQEYRNLIRILSGRN